MTFCISYLWRWGMEFAATQIEEPHEPHRCIFPNRRYHEHLTTAVTSHHGPLPEPENLLLISPLFSCISVRQHANTCCLAIPRCEDTISTKEVFLGGHFTLCLVICGVQKRRFVTA